MIAAVDDLVIEALFVSYLQPSQTPCAEQIETAVTQTLLRFGSDGCAAAVATEFGDHPDTAVLRMCWVRNTLLSEVPDATRTPPPASRSAEHAAQTTSWPGGSL